MLWDLLLATVGVNWAHSYRGAKKASRGLETQGTLEARAFLSEAHLMSNIYFMIFMMVVSYFI